MKKSNFWYLTLCALLIIASVNGWDAPLGVAVVANALVVLMDAVGTIHGFKTDRS